MTFIRPQASELARRLKEPRRFIQVVSGARQVGKTTLALQVAERSKLPYHVASADEPTLRGAGWIESQWEEARLLADSAKRKGALLVLDEVHKVPHWAETVKHLWDEDTRKKTLVKTVLLGSALLLIGRGLTESLAGRFEILHMPHWSFPEMRTAFGWDLKQYLFYGAYPGAAPLIKQPFRWSRYIIDSLIETTVARDVLLLSRVDKPALLRRLFELGCAYSGQILSYTKMTGQLQDAGNTTTLAHYLDLLRAHRLAQIRRRHSAAAEIKPQISSLQHRAANRPVRHDSGGSVCRPRVLGTLDRIRSGRTPAQRIRRRGVRTLLLARAQPRSGFCRAQRKEADGHRSKKRTHHHFTSRHGSVRQILQTRSPVNSRHRRHFP